MGISFSLQLGESSIQSAMRITVSLQLDQSNIQPAMGISFSLQLDESNIQSAIFATNRVIILTNLHPDSMYIRYMTA